MKKYIIVLVIILTAGAGCKKSYTDINQNPNSPTTSSITADFLLPNVQVPMAALVGATGSSYRTLNHWMGQWVRGGDFGANAEEESYKLTTTFGQGLWNNLFNILQDVNTMEVKATAAGQNFYVGAAKVMKVEGFRQLVDMFNDVPYSEALNLGTFIQPKYDKGEAIYKDLFVQLDQAVVRFNAVAPGQNPRTDVADVMFAGNTTSWKKYINTLRLKLILRLSETNGVINVNEQIGKITADGFLNTSVYANVQPGYLVTAGKLNPFYVRHKADENGIESDKFNRANPFTFDSLSSNSDLRLMYYYSPAKVPLSGVQYRAGSPYGQLPGTIASDNQSNVAGPGLAKSPTQSQWLLTAMESLFLQAEARARGYLTSGPSAKELFEEGVRASFIFLNVPNGTAAANTLLTGGRRLYTYPLGGSIPDQVRIIIEQKFFSLVGMAPLEIYSDYRRTGFPIVPLSVRSGAEPKIPLRFPYPQSEYSFNSGSVLSQGSVNTQSSLVFWDK